MSDALALLMQRLGTSVRSVVIDTRAVLSRIEEKVGDGVDLLKEIKETLMATDAKYQQLIDLTKKRTSLEQSLIGAFEGLLTPIVNANAADDDAALDQAIADAQAAIPALAAAVTKGTPAQSVPTAPTQPTDTGSTDASSPSAPATAPADASGTAGTGGNPTSDSTGSNQ